jgi:hypothetical protein
MDMTMGSALPDWLTPLAWTWIALCLASAAWLALDIRVRGRRHDRAASEVVWVASALYLGPVAVALHARSVRAAGAADVDAARAVLPGGAASALAHLVGVPLVVASGLTIAGTDLWVMIAVIAVVATLLLFAHERATATVPAAAALTAALVTVLAFDVGMGGWMLLLHFNDAMSPATEGSFWFLMQVGVVLGLVTGYPAARWFARRGAAGLTASAAARR